jgi:transposase
VAGLPSGLWSTTTVYNRFRRWTMRGLWRRLFDTLTQAERGDVQAIDSTTAKAHRSAAGGKGGPKRRRLVARVAVAQRKLRDRRFRRTPHCARSNAWPAWRRSRRTGPDQRRPARPPPGRRRRLRQGRAAALTRRSWDPACIPNNPTRKRPHPFDEDAYRHRNLIERMFCRLKDWRRIATRYDKLASSFAAAVAIAAVIIWRT